VLQTYSRFDRGLFSLSFFGQTRVYPNLNPSAAVPVDREQIFSLSSFADNYRMRRGKEHGQYVPNAKFTFVKLTSGEMLLHQRFRHPVLAEGRPVLYAGEANFNNGRLEWWSNGSGNYRPDADHAAQAGLPTDQFFTHDQILKGVHAQAKTQPLVERLRPTVVAQSKMAPLGVRTVASWSVPTKTVQLFPLKNWWEL
jgi:hypothetical protein